MQPMICTPENAAEFNAALRAHGDVFAFAKALHGAGLISGLAGAKIRPAGHPDAVREVAVRPTLSLEAERRHADREWAAGTWQDDQADIRAANREWMRRGERNEKGAAR